MIFDFFSIFLLSLVCTVVFSCQCQNGGTCLDSNNICVCNKGFYGPICSNFAESYKIILKETPTDVSSTINKIMLDLSPYHINDTVQITPGNIFKLMFYQHIDATTLVDIQRILMNEQLVFQPGQDVLTDFNECQPSQGQQKCYTDSCVNTVGSFTCGCPDGQQLNSANGKCESNENDTKPVIYIWSAVVVAVVLVMIALIIFYRWRKIEKGKKIQREMEKKTPHLSFSSTNMDEFDGTMMRKSPLGSVIEAPFSGPHMGRPMSGIYNPDGTSLYSYNTRMYSQSDGDYSKHRLSAPVLESYSNGGFDGDGLPLPPDNYSLKPGHLYSTSPSSPGIGPGLQYSTSPTNSMHFPSKNSESGLAGIHENYDDGETIDVIPTSFSTDAELGRNDRYDP